MATTSKPSRLTLLLDFFLESWSANIIICLNMAVYVYLNVSPSGPYLAKHLVLYPGNLVEGRWWCLITSGFLHSSGAHLFMNMLGVFIFARIVERQLGAGKTLFVYFGALFLSMLFATTIYSFLLQKNVAIIGASGAVMGLISAAMLLDPFKVTYEMIIPLPAMFKGWLFLYADIKGMLGGEQDGVSHLAHLCGFLSVGLLVYFLSKKDKKLMRTGLIVNIVSFIVFLFLKRWLETQPFGA